jgi:protein-tyrosine phosphatase
MTSHHTVTVMTVCLGNICRSPMAAAVLRSKVDAAGLGDSVVVESTGTGGWHVGEQADPRARATLLAHGYDPSHTARQFRAADAEHVDLLLAMDAANLRSLRSALGPDPRVQMFRSFDPSLTHVTPPDSRLDVPDPYYGGNDGFVDVLAMIERAADGVVGHLRSTLAGGQL